MNLFVSHTGEDILRKFDEEVRIFMKRDRDTVIEMVKIAMLAILPPKIHFAPLLSFETPAPKRPATLMLTPFEHDFSLHKENGPIGKIIADSIIAVYPLRIFSGFQGGDLEEPGISKLQNPDVLSAHQRIEARIKACEVFGHNSPIYQHLDKN